ncbi:hypothetical protein EJ994_04565 [Maribacter sp. MJ134]|uniref:hypothetical protein n=1 Tax=Maribacter sp. MJ134 TaxID=2496865 RepID=UPI000F833208|nr:hypothetical protein [Maribacter sp. MJ134]AZQ58115.1 hypothetical protein EJ994_04565 [Maribacter sp. MJ134]
MKSFFITVKHDYLQRTRSYTFLITLCASLVIAYTFVPEPNASYSTIRIADYVGAYNSAWFGYVTAIMTSIFLSLIGFYLVNNSIKTDIATKVGQIVASTPVSNFRYLFSKVISNFFVLMTIVLLVFIMSIVLFTMYNAGFPFEPLQFITPYLVITVCSMFFISVLAVLFEVIFGKYAILQNVIFFFLFCSFMFISPKTELQYGLDVFGNTIVMDHFEQTVREITKSDEKTDLSIGYVLGNVTKAKSFTFKGLTFPISFIISRFLWIALGIALTAIVSLVFHRFNLKAPSIKKEMTKKVKTTPFSGELDVHRLPHVEPNYSVLPLLKTEFVLLVRRGKKWLWLINLIGMVLLAFLPLSIAHQMVLPILWFLQAHRISGIVTKERAHNVHYLTLSSFLPVRRLFLSQILSSLLFLILLAVPLLVRLLILQDFISAAAIILGAGFLLFLATFAGIISKGKKLFEMVFFFITYANLNGIPFLDYYGGLPHNGVYLIKLSAFVLLLASVTFSFKIRDTEQ